MHVTAGLAHLRLVMFEIEVEMGEHMVLDVARAVAQGLELGQALGRLRALVDEACAHIAQRLLQLLVAQRVMGVLLEGGGGRVNGHFDTSSLRPKSNRKDPEMRSIQ